MVRRPGCSPGSTVFPRARDLVAVLAVDMPLVDPGDVRAAGRGRRPARTGPCWSTPTAAASPCAASTAPTRSRVPAPGDRRRSTGCRAPAARGAGVWPRSRRSTTRPTTSTPGTTSAAARASADDWRRAWSCTIRVAYGRQATKTLDREPPRLDRRAHGRPRHRGRDGRGAGARRRPRGGPPRRASGRTDQHLPARLRRRGSRRATPRRSRRWPARPRARRELGGRRGPRGCATTTTRPSRRSTSRAVDADERRPTRAVLACGAMRAVIATEPGGPEVLTVTELPDPDPGPGEVVIDVAADGGQPRRPPAAAGLLPAAARRLATSRAGVQRPDRRGRRRRRPAGRSATRCARCSPAAGTPSRCRARRAGDAPAGRASTCRRRRRCPRWPARSGPTCSWSPGLRPDETLLVHGGARRHRHVRDPARHALGRAGRRHRRVRGEARGVPVARRRRGDQLPRAGLRRGGRGDRRRGADVILDNMGAKYLGRNVEALATEGRLVVIGMQGGTKGELDLAPCCASGARSSPPRCGRARGGEGRDLRRRRRARLAAGRRRARSGRSCTTTFPLAEAAAAHAAVEAGEHIGKILLDRR